MQIVVKNTNIFLVTWNKYLLKKVKIVLHKEPTSPSFCYKGVRVKYVRILKASWISGNGLFRRYVVKEEMGSKMHEH